MTIFLHQADEVGPAGDQFGLAGPVAEVLQHFRLGRRRCVFEIFHCFTPGGGQCCLNFKSQAPNFKQAPSTKIQMSRNERTATVLSIANFGNLNLFVAWCL
jgi:hypothetical protein